MDSIFQSEGGNKEEWTFLWLEDFLRNQPLVPNKKLTKILGKKPNILRRNVIKSGKKFEKKGPKKTVRELQGL